jgi:hypothetical protein
MLFSRHAGNDKLESFSKATHSLAISLFMCKVSRVSLYAFTSIRAGTDFWKKPRSAGGEMP